MNLTTVIIRQPIHLSGQPSPYKDLLREKHPVLILQVDGGELVIGTAENFWNELSKVHTPALLTWCSFVFALQQV